VPLGDGQNAEPVGLNSIPPLDLRQGHSDAKKGTESDAQDEALETDIEAASGREGDEEGGQFLSDWSRSQSPTALPPIPTSKKDKLDWDAAQEMDVEAEEGEFAEFLSQVKGKDLDTVREEIDAEIRQLNKEKKNAQRDSEEMNQQTVAQIMVCDCRTHSRT
jgi:DNA excision repair protein ERCC-5